MALPKGETGQTGTCFTWTGLASREEAARGDPKSGRGGRPFEKAAAAAEREEAREEEREDKEERSEEREERADPALERAAQSEAREEEREERAELNFSASAAASFFAPAAALRTDSICKLTCSDREMIPDAAFPAPESSLLSFKASGPSALPAEERRGEERRDRIFAAASFRGERSRPRSRGREEGRGFKDKVREA